MSLTMYEASAPVFRQLLGSLCNVLKAGEGFATAAGIDQAALLQARLHPTMFPLVRQAQIATDHAKGAMARLGGLDPPSFPDSEQSFAELYERIASTLEFVDSISPDRLTGSETREVLLPFGDGRKLSGAQYLLGFALPNFIFHVTTAYDILRHAGVDIGKRDFLGSGWPKLHKGAVAARSAPAASQPEGRDPRAKGLLSRMGDYLDALSS